MELKLTDGQRQQLIDEVIEQIKCDIGNGDVSALDELLKICPNSNLTAYLPDDRMDSWNKTKDNEFTAEEIEDFKYDWGQTHREVCEALGYSARHSESDELLMEDYFYIEKDKKWYNKCASLFTEREQEIADYLRS